MISLISTTCTGKNKYTTVSFRLSRITALGRRSATSRLLIKLLLLVRGGPRGGICGIWIRFSYCRKCVKNKLPYANVNLITWVVGLSRPLLVSGCTPALSCVCPSSLILSQWVLCWRCAHWSLKSYKYRLTKLTSHDSNQQVRQ